MIFYDYILSVAVSHDGAWVVSGSKGPGVQSGDSKSAIVQCMLQGHKNSAEFSSWKGEADLHSIASSRLSRSQGSPRSSSNIKTMAINVPVLVRSLSCNPFPPT